MPAILSQYNVLTKQTANYLLNSKLKLHNNMGTDGCCCCSARPSLICCQTQQPRITCGRLNVLIAARGATLLLFFPPFPHSRYARHVRNQTYDGLESQPDEAMTAEDTFRVSAFTVIIDSLVAALQKRSQADERISARFGFLLNVLSMTCRRRN